MEKFIIQGKNLLKGEISVSGAKNSALKLLAASILIPEECRITNVPDIADIRVMVDILKDLGAEVRQKNTHEYIINTKNVKKTEINPDLAARLRSSIMLVTPLLARFGEVKFPYPGGCIIGKRPIDIFLEGFKAFGAEVEEKNSYFHIKAKRLKGCRFVFPWIAVTVTESLIMAAILAEGTTILENCAQEPEIQAMCDYFNSCGAKIKGAGTSTIKIQGVNEISGGTFHVIPDRIETGTFAVLAALAGEGIKISSCNPKHLEVFWKMLGKTGVKLDIEKDFVYIKKSSDFKPLEVRTHEYPGFVTDLQSPFTVLLTQANGLSLVHETIYEGRLLYTDKLNRMGANIIMCDPHRIVIQGPTPLYGVKMESPDLRAGMALLIAALTAQGKSEIENIYQIDRGYENIEERLKRLGADIKRVT